VIRNLRATSPLCEPRRKEGSRLVGLAEAVLRFTGQQCLLAPPWVVVIGSLLLFTWGCAASFKQLTPLQEQERAQVYSAVLDEIVKKAPADCIVVLRTTVTPSSSLLDRNHPSYHLWQSVHEYEARDVSIARSSCDLEFISAADATDLWGRSASPGWGGFYARFPDAEGLLRFSEVVFDVDGDSALVYAFIGSDRERGFGGLYELAKLGGAWRVSEEIVSIHS